MRLIYKECHGVEQCLMDLLGVSKNDGFTPIMTILNRNMVIDQDLPVDSGAITVGLPYFQTNTHGNIEQTTEH